MVVLNGASRKPVSLKYPTIFFRPRSSAIFPVMPYCHWHYDGSTATVFVWYSKYLVFIGASNSRTYLCDSNLLLCLIVIQFNRLSWSTQSPFFVRRVERLFQQFLPKPGLTGRERRFCFDQKIVVTMTEQKFLVWKFTLELAATAATPTAAAAATTVVSLPFDDWWLPWQRR